MLLNFYLDKRTADSVPVPSRLTRKNSEYENHVKICRRLRIAPNRIGYFAAIAKLAERIKP